MNPTMQMHRRAIATGAMAILVAAAAGACGNGAAAADSPYCTAARQWSVHEMDPRDDADPAAFKAYWADYLAFMEKGVALSPKPIHADWVVYRETVSKQTPVLEKYGYNKRRFEAAASPQEKAAFESPGEAADKAFQNVLAYEALTCSTAQPLAADVDFSNEQPGPYCDVVVKDNERIQHVAEAGLAPADVKALVEDKAYLDKLDTDLVATAPSAIRADVAATVKWWQQRQRPVLAKFGYDMRKILLTGSDRDRRALQLTDHKVAGHFARTIAYEQQVCGQ